MGLKNIEIFTLGVKGCRLKYYPDYFNRGEEFDFLTWDLRKDDKEFRRYESELHKDGYEYNDGHLSYQFYLKIAYHAQRLSLHPPSKIYYYKAPNDGSLKWHQEYGAYELSLFYFCESKRINLVPVLREEISELSDKQFLSEMKDKYKNVKDMNQAICYGILEKFIDEPIIDNTPEENWQHNNGVYRIQKQELEQIVAAGDPTELSYFKSCDNMDAVDS